DVVEAAAMDLPGLAVGAFGPSGIGLQAEIEMDEIEGAADPGDAGDDMQPAQPGAQPFAQHDIHRGPLLGPVERLRQGAFPPPYALASVREKSRLSAKSLPKCERGGVQSGAALAHR